MYYYFSFLKQSIPSAATALEGKQNCVENEIRLMNATSISMGTSLLVLDSDGKLYSDDPNFVFYLDGFSVHYYNFTAFAIPVLLIVNAIFFIAYSIFWSVRCCRKKSCNKHP